MKPERIKNAGGAIGRVIAQRSSLILALLGVVVSIGLYHISEGTVVPLWALFYVCLFSLISTYMLLEAIRLVLSERPTFPQVLAVFEDEGSSQPVLLTESSELFGTGTLVSIYYREPVKGFEVLLAHGSVRTVQLDSKVQIQIEQWEPGNAAVQTKIQAQDPDALHRLIVRPSVSRGRDQDRPSGSDWQAMLGALVASYEETRGENGNG